MMEVAGHKQADAAVELPVKQLYAGLSVRVDDDDEKKPLYTYNSVPKLEMLDEVIREHVHYARKHWVKERILLLRSWRLFLLGVFFQYVHSVATNLAYYLHTPRQPLFDMGFALLPALPHSMQILSEVVFFSLIFTTVLFAVSPFFRVNYFISTTGKTGRHEQKVYMAHMLARFLSVLVICQALRILSFMSTSLPGPNYHCRPGSLVYSPPKTAKDIFFRQDAFLGCGDLVFSSHTTFVLLCALTIQRYSSVRLLKQIVWGMVCVCLILIIAARKHYTLDVVVACYTVPLVWIAFERFYPDRPLPSTLGENKVTGISPRSLRSNNDTSSLVDLERGKD